MVETLGEIQINDVQKKFIKLTALAPKRLKRSTMCPPPSTQVNSLP